MKLLFVLHSGDLVYGAAKSLQYILKNIDSDYDLLCTKRLLNKHSESELRAFAGPKLKKIYSAWLPYEWDELLLEPIKSNLISSSKRWLRKWLTAFQYKIDQIKINQIFVSGNYDIIHLNSLTLYPLLSTKFNMVIHVRELHSGKNQSKAIKKLNQSKLIVFIDVATKEQMYGLKSESIILENPVDMTTVNDCEIYGSLENTTVIFSIIGVLQPEKGVEFVIRNFMKVKTRNMQLIIVGDGPADYKNKCKNMAISDDRIVFWGHTNKINEIYKISDYIIRADIMYAVGRTVLEGLYSGCEILMQGEDSDIDKLMNDEFKRKVHFYQPRDDERFIAQIERLSKHKVENKVCSGNIKSYMNAFNSAITRVASKNKN